MPVGLGTNTLCVVNSGLLFTVPEEIIIQILLHLSTVDISRASQTCRDLFDIVTNSALLRYHMELEICGLAHVGDGRKELTTDERLTLLKDRQYRWKNMDWRREDNRSLSEGCPTYEIYGGVFAQLFEAMVFDDEKKESRWTTKLKVHYLPSAARNLDEIMTIEHEDLRAGAVHELSIDPDQDLVVLLEYARSSEDQVGNRSLQLVIHLRTLSTSSPHPAAVEPEITPRYFKSVSQIGRVIPIIVGDMLAILYNQVDGVSPSTIVVWRWTTSETLMMVQTPTPALSFNFLSDDTIVVPCTSQFPEWSANLYIYQIPTGGIDLNTLPILVYQLPALNNNTISGINVVCRSHPLPNPRAYKPPNSIPATVPAASEEDAPDPDNEVHDHRPAADPLATFHTPAFQTDATDRLVTFSFIFNVHHLYEQGSNEQDPQAFISWQASYVLVTHVSSLLADVRLYEPSSPQSPVPHIIKWEDWSKRTRWLVDRCRRNWYSHTYGHRFIRPTLMAADNPGESFSPQILDFNPWTIRTESASRAERKVGTGNVVELEMQGAWYSILHSADLPKSVSACSSGTSDLGRARGRGRPATESLTFPAFNLAWFTTVKLVTEPSTISGAVFVEPVTTSLPYLEVTNGDTLRDFQGLMICEEQVVNVKAFGPDLEMNVFSV
ncbi:hypothetical protein FRB94_005930 [Tulasnella sp. JGI-2019a]|nr:hypothetical protein FRB93_005197 [Tulasnella sp. JGI-2019a]KAG8999797.1 hypothetical protein FRB94_005930 [Tulasnella sp. JGI-2019a]KAG9028310.1 hypothetical protein FRB95_006614 [Tulasnella sp. JGI-2019a]